jgi:D-sedoheptulose 7-phosphate isomerase
MNSISSSYFASLNRHREIFHHAEQYADQALEMLSTVQRSLDQGGKIVWMGNGGSAADAQHLAAEFMVRYHMNRKPFASISLSTDTSILTAHSNDYEFSTVFSRQIEGIVKPSDTVIGLTTSGNSDNIVLGLKAANSIGAHTIALTGCSGGKVSQIAKLSIIVQSNETARIQEMHMFLGHWLCEALDLFPISQNNLS